MENQFNAGDGIRKIREIAGRWLTPGSEVKARDAMHQVVNVLLDTRFDVEQVFMLDPNPERIELICKAIAAADKHPGQLVAYSNGPVEHVWFSQASLDIGAERRRQIEVEGRTLEHDDEYTNGDLAAAAGCYALHAHDDNASMEGAPVWWPWETEWWKPGDPRRNLVKAGALILAEIERLDRAAAAKGTDLPPEEVLPEGLSWETAPEWAAALVEGDANNVDITDRCLVWVRAVGVESSGILAIGFRGRKAGDHQSVDMKHPAHFWSVVSTRPAPASDAWIEWDGTKGIPMDASAIVDIELRNGKTVTAVRAGDYAWRFHHGEGENDVVTYRMHKAAAVDGGWINWDGRDELPSGLEPGQMVWVRLQETGAERPGHADRWTWGWEQADHRGIGRIVAYRLSAQP